MIRESGGLNDIDNTMLKILSERNGFDDVLKIIEQAES